MKKHLLVAIITFVLLDLGTLAFSFTIARQVEKDAVAINLSGRQRMLSQRLTKAALLASNPARSETQRGQSAAEAHQAFLTFRKTLGAFAEGGEAQGGDGKTVQLKKVQGKAAELVRQVHDLFAPWPHAPSSQEEMEKFSRFMDERNNEILDAMNQLTSELEYESITSVERLRIAQGLAFMLSLVNFVFILIRMRRAQLEAEADSITDALTGLLNRGGFYRELDAALARRPDDKAHLGVMLLDLNDFKAVNDLYGHAVGDDTLREVARRMQDLTKKEGWVCGRLGGDEFGVVCPALDPRQLAFAAEKTSRLLANIPGGESIVSASVGWASATAGQSADDVIATADAMMYSIKHDRHVSGIYRSNQR